MDWDKGLVRHHRSQSRMSKSHGEDALKDEGNDCQRTITITIIIKGLYKAAKFATEKNTSRCSGRTVKRWSWGVGYQISIHFKKGHYPSNSFLFFMEIMPSPSTTNIYQASTKQHIHLDKLLESTVEWRA